MSVLPLPAVDGDNNEEEDPDPRQLDGVPLEVQEAWICEDLMFVLQVCCDCCSDAIIGRMNSVFQVLKLTSQGVEGSLIRYDETYDPMNEDHRLAGAKWRIDPSLGATTFLLFTLETEVKISGHG